MSASVLIIKDREGCVYGGYASQPWERHSDFYGDMKSFLFQLYPNASIFRPTGANTNIQWVCMYVCMSLLFYVIADQKKKTCAVCYELHIREHPKRHRIRRKDQPLWSVFILELRPRPDVLLHYFW